MDQYEYKAHGDHYSGEAGVPPHYGLASPPPLYPSPGESGLQSASSLGLTSPGPEARSDTRKGGHIYH